MSWVLPGAASLVLLVLLAWRVFHRPGRSRTSVPPSLPPARPPRPLEDIVSDARRFSARVHEPPRGTSFAKHVAACTVYDRVLGEACAALDIEHLLGVLPPGEDRDAERTRIETALWLAGLRLEDAA
jgi:hypothetical protein